MSKARKAKVVEPVIFSDTDRLNWLIEHKAYISHSRDYEVCSLWFSYDPDDDSNGPVPVEGYPQKCYYEPREAIDKGILFYRRKK